MGNENILDKIVDNESIVNSEFSAHVEAANYEEQSDQLAETLSEIQKSQINRLNSKIDRYKEDTLLRSSLATVFTIIIAFWLLSVILILVLNNSKNYNLSDNVLITLMVTTTANVIGMMLIILRNLFPPDENNRSSRN